MGNESYKEKYIECYNLVLDIIQLCKNFLNPGEYTFDRIPSSLSLDEQISLIRKDLESINFEREVFKQLVDELSYYFPGQESDLSSLEFFLEESFGGKLKIVKSKLNDTYIPFIKLSEIRQFQFENNQMQYNDEEAWEEILMSENNVKLMEDLLKDIIWAFYNDSSEQLVNETLQDHYKLNDLEFIRYLHASKSQKCSIKRSAVNKNKINVNFKNFDKCFGDIYGQDESIEKIRKCLLRNIWFYNAEDIDEHATNSNKGPLATFMFYGPTGTGKTETAKRIAKFVYGSDRKLLILDMNSYKDARVSASFIKGHPEGYVDSSKGTDFTRFLQKNNNGIVVLDEFEKAASEVRELFMTMLDEGTFKDALGNVYDLSGYIFIATTNVSKIFENRPRQIGFGGDSKDDKRNEEEKIRDELRDIFTAPIMNRFNNVIRFKEIDKDDAMSISENLINKLINKFESKRFNGITPSIKIENIDEIAAIILRESNFRKDGVRSIKNVINDLIGSQVLEKVVCGEENILITASKGQLQFSTISNKENFVAKRIR